MKPRHPRRQSRWSTCTITCSCSTKGPVPEGDHLVPFGVADVKRAGTDVTIVATGWMVAKIARRRRNPREGRNQRRSDRSANSRAARRRDDRRIRVKRPAAWCSSIRRRATPPPRPSSPAEVAEHGFHYLKSPVKMVTALDTSDPLQRAARNPRSPERRENHAGSALSAGSENRRGLGTILREHRPTVGKPRPWLPRRREPRRMCMRASNETLSS